MDVAQFTRDVRALVARNDRRASRRRLVRVLALRAAVRRPVRGRVPVQRRVSVADERIGL